MRQLRINLPVSSMYYPPRQNEKNNKQIKTNLSFFFGRGREGAIIRRLLGTTLSYDLHALEVGLERAGFPRGVGDFWTPFIEDHRRWHFNSIGLDSVRNKIGQTATLFTPNTIKQSRKRGVTNAILLSRSFGHDTTWYIWTDMSTHSKNMSTSKRLFDMLNIDSDTFKIRLILRKTLNRYTSDNFTSNYIFYHKKS